MEQIKFNSQAINCDRQQMGKQCNDGVNEKFTLNKEAIYTPQYRRITKDSTLENKKSQLVNQYIF